MDILVGNYAVPRWDLWSPDTIRIVNWNIDRGLRLPEITGFLASQKADVVLLQEVDLNARRTNVLNIAEEIARELQMNYVFGREFQELTQGHPTSPAYHGQATLSRWSLRNPRVIRFSRQSDFWRPRWYLPRMSLFQERLGGRIALVTEVEIRGERLAVYNLHLESRGDENLRLAQLEETIEDAARQARRLPTLLAGDLNFDVSHAAPASALNQVGFRNVLGMPSPHTTTPRGLFQRRRTIDWAYVSGPVEPILGRVHDTVSASDHYPISFTLKFLSSRDPRASG
jgi:endonuclease/exonuclease/phosphatase family metal-dependent hydrolase